MAGEVVGNEAPIITGLTLWVPGCQKTSQIYA